MPLSRKHVAALALCALILSVVAALWHRSGKSSLSAEFAAIERDARCSSVRAEAKSFAEADITEFLLAQDAGVDYVDKLPALQATAARLNDRLQTCMNIERMKRTSPDLKTDLWVADFVYAFGEIYAYVSFGFGTPSCSRECKLTRIAEIRRAREKLVKLPNSPEQPR